jgi:hypothetical protein
MATDAAPALTLYSRNYCHLCDEMVAALLELQRRAAFTLEIVDVDGDPGLDQRLGERVPVLMAGARELCRHRLERAQVLAFLEQPGH